MIKDTENAGNTGTGAVIAIDAGTTSVRAILYGKNGAMALSAQREISQFYPDDGYVEEDGEEIFEAAVYCLRSVLEGAARIGEKVCAVGITNQRETVLVWDRKTGSPLYRAIVWQCRRSAGICDELRKAGYEGMIKEKTGLVLDPYFSATKLKWLFDRKSDLKEKARRGELLCGTVDSFLLFRLTGGKAHATDVTNASRTMLFNINTIEWDRDLLDLLDIPEGILPKVESSACRFGETSAEICGARIPVCSMIGDQQAALFGQRCFLPGDAKCTYGTGSFLLVNTGARTVTSESGLVSGIAWGIDGKTTYCLEGSVFIGGAAIKWLRDGLKIISSSPEIDRKAAMVSDNGGVYFVPAFVGLGAPYWDINARGIFCGITAAATDCHFCRAVLESMAYQVNEILKCAVSDAVKCNIPMSIHSVKADGGACVSDVLMQFQSDISDITVRCDGEAEKTAKGAALMALIGAGEKTVDQLAAEEKTINESNPALRTYRPIMDKEKVKAGFEGWYKAIAKSRL